MELVKVTILEVVNWLLVTLVNIELLQILVTHVLLHVLLVLMNQQNVLLVILVIPYKELHVLKMLLQSSQFYVNMVNTETKLQIPARTVNGHVITVKTQQLNV